MDDNSAAGSVRNVERWISHSAMSDTSRHDAAVAEISSSVGALSAAVQGFIIHTEWLDAYGVNASDFASVSRDTLPVADRLALVLRDDARPLTARRSPAKRTVGTCRDFALVLCGLLRSKGISARLRCGFAKYFGDGWVNAVRDHYAINNRETSDWDNWRDAPQSKRIVTKEDCAVLDAIAVRPEQPIIDVNPDWPT
jgi:hypothetical protein